MFEWKIDLVAVLGTSLECFRMALIETGAVQRAKFLADLHRWNSLTLGRNIPCLQQRHWVIAWALTICCWKWQRSIRSSPWQVMRAASRSSKHAVGRLSRSISSRWTELVAGRAPNKSNSLQGQHQKHLNDSHTATERSNAASSDELHESDNNTGYQQRRGVDIRVHRVLARLGFPIYDFFQDGLARNERDVGISVPVKCDILQR